MCIHLHTQVPAYVHTYTHVHTVDWMPPHTHTHVYIGVCVCMYVIHTNIHTLTCIKVMLFRGQIVENLTIVGFILMLIRIQYWNHVETALSKMTCVPLTEKRKKKV